MIVLKKILVATDFSEPSKAALRYGVELARKFGSSLHVLHVVDDLAAHPTAVPGGLAMDLGALQTELESAARDNLSALLPEPDRTAVRGRFHVMVSTMPGTAIVDFARTSPAWRVEDAVSFRTARLTKLSDDAPPFMAGADAAQGRMRFAYLPPHRRVVASARQRLFSTRAGLWAVRRLRRQASERR